MGEQEVIAGEFIMDPIHCDAPDQATVAEAIIAISEKDTASTSIRRMDSMHRQPTACTRKHSDGIGPFLERYQFCAHAYLNIVSGNVS